MAHNGEAGGSGGGGYKSCLPIPEAAFFAEHGIPVPPGLRIPSSGGWALSAMGYVVPPYPQSVERLHALAQSRRRTLTPEQRADPSYAVDGLLWPEIFKIERDAALDDAPPDGTICRNCDARHRCWGNRTIHSVLREYGYVQPTREQARTAVPWLGPPCPSERSSSPRIPSSGSSARSSAATSVKREGGHLSE